MSKIINKQSDYISLQDFFGPTLAPEIREHFQPLTASWVKDSIPAHGSYQEFEMPECADYVPPETVVRALETIRSQAVRGKSKLVKHFNGKYVAKMSRRNGRLGAVTLMKFSEISGQNTWLDQSATTINSNDVVDTLQILCPAVNEGMHVGWIEPPKEQASMGLYIRLMPDGTLKMYTGAKGPLWVLAYKSAKDILQRLLQRQYTWHEIESTSDLGRSLGLELAREYLNCFVPAWRLDGGLEKLRLLLIGVITWYIIEQWFGHNIHHAMLRNDHFGYYPPNVMNFFESGLKAGYQYLSGDIIGYDLHQQPRHLLAVYKGVQQYCNLPESVAVALFLYNCYTPAIVPVPRYVKDSGKGHLEYYTMLKLRNGQAASGIGFFATANTIGNATANRKVALKLCDEWEPGIYMGDNHVQPIKVGVALWRRKMNEMCAFGMDIKDTIRSPSDAYFLRRFFNKGSRDSTPNVMSRARNLLYPEYNDPWSMHPVRRAIVYRAQGAEIISTANSTMLEAFETIGPFASYRYDWGTDRELSKIYQQLDGLHLAKFGTDDADDNLSRAMQWVNVDDSSKLM